MSLLQKWNTEKINQYNEKSEQALLIDEQTLVSFSQDFGKLIQSQPSAVFLPENINSLQSLIQFAHQESLPVTIRGNGLSQCGQSLPVPGGVTVSMQKLNKPLDFAEDNAIWVEANTSWSDLLKISLSQLKAPFVLPYNCNLSVGGVLSAGGVGSSSFKFGAVNAYVKALEVIDGTGVKHIVDTNSPLFHACLSGQGRFAVITKACINLRAVKPQLKTFCLVYADQQQWFSDVCKLKDTVDYMELFCSSSIQGAKLKDGRRVPMAQWLYGLHLSIEYEKQEPDLKDFVSGLTPWTIINTQEESIHSYFLRHDFRFEAMKISGQWDLYHPWYECFIGTNVLNDHLDELLQELPIHYASLVHVVPMAKLGADFLMLPEGDSVCSIMILNPGVPEPLKDSCLQAIKVLDNKLIKLGGKRYLSGFLGYELPKNYWQQHFGDQHDPWVSLKKRFDPAGIFNSMLHNQ